MITLLCCPPFQMSFRPLVQKCLGFCTEMKTQRNVYSYFVNGKEKQMCLHVNERKFETFFGGLFSWNYSENCFMMSRTWGCYVWVCTVCVHVCMCVRVWACRHVLKWVINQSKSVTLSSAWKRLCSLKPDWFISASPKCRSTASLVITLPRFNKPYVGDSSRTAKAFVVISNSS